MNENQKNEELTRAQLADLLYREFQYRQTLLWSVTKFYIILIVSLYAFPIFSINTAEIQKLGFRLILFPVLAILTTFIGWWHIRCESDRFKTVYNKYLDVRGRENRSPWPYDGEKRTFMQQLSSENMNELILSLYFILSLVFFVFGTLIIIEYSFIENAELIDLNRIKIYLAAIPIPVHFG